MLDTLNIVFHGKPVEKSWRILGMGGPDMSGLRAGLLLIQQEGLAFSRIILRAYGRSGHEIAMALNAIAAVRISESTIAEIDGNTADALGLASLPSALAFHVSVQVHDGPWDPELASGIERLGRRLVDINGSLSLRITGKDQVQTDNNIEAADAWRGWLNGHGWGDRLLGPGTTGWGVEDSMDISFRQKLHIESRKACAAPWSKPALCTDGGFLACRRTEAGKIRLENATTSFLQVWSGSTITELRKAHISGNLWHYPQCLYCSCDGFLDYNSRYLSLEERSEYVARLESNVVPLPEPDTVPESADILEEAAIQCERSGHFADAARIVARLLNAVENSAPAAYLREWTYRLITFSGRAEAEDLEMQGYIRLVELGCDPVDRARASRLLREAGKIDQAAGLWHGHEPDIQEAREALAALKEQGDFEIMADMATKLNSLSPDDEYILENLGYAEYRLGHFERACEPLLQSGNSGALRLAAQCLREAGHLDKAVELATRIIEQDGEDSFLIRLKADVHYEKEEWQHALSGYLKLEILQDAACCEQEDLSIRKGWCRLHSGNFREAVIEVAHALRGDNDIGAISEALEISALAAKELSQFTEALDYARRLKEISPESARARQIIAWCRARLRPPRKSFELNSRLFPVKWSADLQLGVTDACNSSCSFCNQSAKAPILAAPLSRSFHLRGHEHMSLDTFDAILGNIEKDRLRFTNLMLFWLGEPFLNPHFMAMLNRAFVQNDRKRFFRTLCINTNGTMLTDDIMRDIAEYARKPRGFMHITFSLDALHSSTARNIKGADEKLHISSESLKTMARMVAEQGLGRKLRLTAQMVICPENCLEAADFARSWSAFFIKLGLGGEITFDDGFSPACSIRIKAANSAEFDSESLFELARQRIEGKIDNSVLAEKKAAIAAAGPVHTRATGNAEITGLQDDLKSYFPREAVLLSPHIPECDKGRFACGGPWRTPTIAPDGTLTVCCNDINLELALGNAARESIRNLWLGDKAAGIREKHVQGRACTDAVCCLCKGLRYMRPEDIKKIEGTLSGDTYRERTGDSGQLSESEMLKILPEQSGDLRLAGWRMALLKNKGDIEAQGWELRTLLTEAFYQFNKINDYENKAKLKTAIEVMLGHLAGIWREVQERRGELAARWLLYRMNSSAENAEAVAACALESGRWNYARRGYEALLDAVEGKERQVEILHRLAVIYKALDEPVKAAEIWQSIPEGDGREAERYRALMHCYIQLGDTEKGRYYGLKAMEKDPDDLELRSYVESTASNKVHTPPEAADRALTKSRPSRHNARLVMNRLKKYGLKQS